MGDYAYMQGKAVIRPTYIKPLQAFFNSRHTHAEYELDWPSLEFSMPDVVVYSGWQLLALRHGMGSERMPYGMPNPTGWPDDFDDLESELGELTLDDAGNLSFKCSNRNYFNVMEAFIQLVMVWSDSYTIDLDLHEFSFNHLFESGPRHTTYTHDTVDKNDALIDLVAEAHSRLERDIQLKSLAPLSDEEVRKLQALGISPKFIEGLNGPSSELSDVPKEEKQVRGWSAIVHNKLDVLGIQRDLFQSASPMPFENFAEFLIRLGQIRVRTPDPREMPVDTPQFESITDHIEQHKLFNRGKKGVVQLTRKSRRKAK